MRYPGSELYSPLMKSKFHTIMAVDIETTGLDYWRNEILSMSLGAMDYETMEPIASEEFVFRPKNLQYWSVESQRIHKISIAEAIHFEPKAEATRRFMQFFEKHCKGVPQILVCHAFDKYRTGAFFDVAFIMAHLEKFGLREQLYKQVRFFESTDTYFRGARARGYYRASADIFSKDGELQEGKDFKLSTLCKTFKIKLDHHDAKSDREACQALYRIARSFGTYDEENALELQEQEDGEDSQGPQETRWEVHNPYGPRRDGYNETTLES